MHVVDGVEMVDVREAARLAHRSPETIRRWVWTGKVQAIKHGTKFLIPRASVAAAGDVADETQTDLTLAEWISWSEARHPDREPRPAGSAANLVLEDRDERSGLAGH